jgi:pyruvate/2-oxoglutarate dehydrogenase complex dihydrolipoamide acyltransferase (E2) component
MALDRSGGSGFGAGFSKRWLVIRSRMNLMPVEVVMPKLGLNMTEGIILEWLKQEGDQVIRGEPLFVVETDKVTSETQAQDSGTLARILIPAGETVPVRTVVALITRGGQRCEAPAQRLHWR